MSQDSIVVTGGAGFIGRAVVDRLISDGRTCVVIDAVDPKINGVEFHQADITDLASFQNALNGERRVIHLAGLVAGPANKDPYAAATVNVQGAANALEACRQKGVDKIVLASTFFVYEDCGFDEVDEQTSLDMTIMSPFARSKYMVEQLARDYSGKYDLCCIPLRFGSVYGPGAGSNVIGEFVSDAVEGREIVVWGKGARHRQFVYVGDIADAVLKAIEHDDNGVYNIAGDKQTTTREILEIVQSQIPSVEVSYDTTKPERVQPYHMSLSAAERDLGWRPATDIDKGVSETIAWFKDETNGAR